MPGSCGPRPGLCCPPDRRAGRLETRKAPLRDLQAMGPPSGEHLTALELSGLYEHSDFLVIFGFDRNDREMRRLEFLDQRSPDSGIFNQDVGGLMQPRVLRYLRPQGREVKPAA